jgi:TnsA endonuclease C terminal/TnsA endonuclease N terminal
VAIKPAADLGSARTLEKLEIERVYWAARKIPWRIITERELPRALVKNMKWIHTHLDLVKSGEFSNDQIHRIRITMESDVMQGQRSLVQIAAACDDRLGLKPGAALCVTRHLIGTGIWPVDLTVEIDPQQPLCIIRKPINHEIAA